MDQSASDDTERANNRAKLYAPPRGVRGVKRRMPAALAMTRQQALAMTAQVAAEDAKRTRRASG